ncbi:MAG: DEAD/DEAH box helicase [Planctomycetota bacterium]
MLQGNPDRRRDTYARTPRGFLIGNYEQLFRGLEDLQSWNPDLVVLDEAHRIKNPETLTARCVQRLQPTYRLLMTGTPFQNRLAEFGAVASWVDDRALEPQWRLTAAHTWYTEKAGSPNGLTHLKALRARVAPFLVRRLRSDVVGDLPPRRDTFLPVPSTDRQQAAHLARVNAIRELLKLAEDRPLTTEEFLHLMTLLNSQRMIANSMVLLDWDQTWKKVCHRRPTNEEFRALDSPKLEALCRIVDEILSQPGRRVIIFSQWRRLLELSHWALREVLAGHAARAVFFSGPERAKQRQTNLVEFHDDPATRVLFATDAGGTGLNLQRAADCCILFEVPWNPAVTEQRIARIHRLGQRRPIDVFHLVSEESIECHLSNRVQMKKSAFDAVLDGTEDQVELRGMSIFEQILPIVDPDLSADELAEEESSRPPKGASPERPPSSGTAAENPVTSASNDETNRSIATAVPTGDALPKRERAPAEEEYSEPPPATLAGIAPAALDTSHLDPEVSNQVTALLEQVLQLLSTGTSRPPT